jgi:hypothetical protein
MSLLVYNLLRHCLVTTMPVVVIVLQQHRRRPSSLLGSTKTDRLGLAECRERQTRVNESLDHTSVGSRKHELVAPPMKTRYKRGTRYQLCIILKTELISILITFPNCCTDIGIRLFSSSVGFVAELLPATSIKCPFCSSG